MNIFVLVIFLIIVFVFSYLITCWIRSYALKHGIIDLPCKRSSHTKPTPRGAGLSVSLIFLFCLILLQIIYPTQWRLWSALGAGSLIISLVGWLDDRFGLPRSVRLTAHLVAASWAVFILGGLPTIRTGNGLLELGMLGNAIAVLSIVWFVNLYNFMDGIDGLAAGNAVLVALAAGGLSALSGGYYFALIYLILAFAVAGFLPWNWPPAKVFMGDAGSANIGFLLAVLGIAAENANHLHLLVWFILSEVFIIDATATLFRRILIGREWLKAHKSHAYQRAVQIGNSHLAVTVAIMVINIVLITAAVYAFYNEKMIIPIAVCTSVAIFAAWVYYAIYRYEYKRTSGDA